MKDSTKIWLQENVGLKLLALAFAAALWFFVVGEREDEVGFLISANFTDVPQGMMVVDVVPATVEVRLVGAKTLLQDISPTELNASLDLSKVGEGINSIPVDVGNVSAPRGVKVIKVRPGLLKVTIGSTENKIEF